MHATSLFLVSFLFACCAYSAPLSQEDTGLVAGASGAAGLAAGVGVVLATTPRTNAVSPLPPAAPMAMDPPPRPPIAAFQKGDTMDAVRARVGALTDGAAEMTQRQRMLLSVLSDDGNAAGAYKVVKGVPVLSRDMAKALNTAFELVK